MQAIRVAVVEEGEIFRRGVTACLEEDPATLVVHSSSTPNLAVEVDLVVTSGRAARTRMWDVPLVVCEDDAWAGPELAPDGVSAVLPRADLKPEQLLGAVHAVAAGLRIQQGTSTQPDLGTRHVAVLSMLAGGAATRDICDELGFSERTIKTVIHDVEKYLEARTRAEAVAKAIRMGII